MAHFKHFPSLVTLTCSKVELSGTKRFKLIFIQICLNNYLFFLLSLPPPLSLPPSPLLSSSLALFKLFPTLNKKKFSPAFQVLHFSSPSGPSLPVLLFFLQLFYLTSFRANTRGATWHGVTPGVPPGTVSRRRRLGLSVPPGTVSRSLRLTRSTVLLVNPAQHRDDQQPGSAARLGVRPGAAGPQRIIT